MDFAVSAAIRASDKLSTVFNRMGVNVNKFGSQAEGSFARAAQGAAGMFKAVLGANLVTGVIRRIGREIGQLPRMLTEFTERADAIGKQSRTIGLTAEAFQRLQYAGKLANVTGELMQTSFEQLNKQMGSMKIGTGTLVSVVQKLNPVLARQLRTVGSTENAFLLVSEAVKQATSASQRAAIAQAAFGRSGQEMLPLLLEGSIGIQRLMQEASKYGNIIGDRAVAAAEHFNDTLTRLKSGVTAVKDRILTLAMTGLQPIIEKATEWLAANKELIATKLSDFVGRVGRLLQDMQPVLGLVVKAVTWLVGNKDRLIGLYLAWIGAQIALNIAMHANPIGYVILGLEALIGIVALVVTHWKEIKDWVTKAWEAIKSFAVGIWDTVIPYVKAFGGTLMKYWLLPLNLVVDAVRGLLWVLSKLPGKAGGAFQGALDAVTAFQDKSNAILTGTANQVGFGELFKGLGEKAPNVMQRPQVNVTVPVSVDNRRAPGVTSDVRHAPALYGNPGANP